MDRLRQNTLKILLSITALFSIFIAYAALPWPYTLSVDGVAVFWIPILPLAITVIWLSMRKISKLDEARTKKLVTAMISLAIFAQVIIAVTIHFDTNAYAPYDLSVIYQEAVDMIEQGTTKFVSTPLSPYYFQFYPHNANLTILLYWVFRIGALAGIERLDMLGEFLNVAAMLSCYISLYSIASHLYTRKKAAYATIFLLMNMSFYVFIPSYYTDIISIGFLSPSIAIAVNNHDKKGKKRIFLLFIAGALFTVALKIRITNIFVLLAAIAYYAITGDIKKYIRPASIWLTGVICMWVCANAIYSYHVPYDTSDTAFPVTHWLMMGSCEHNNCMFCDECVVFTIRQPTQAEKRSATWNKYVENIKEHGVGGTAAMIAKKETIVWATGDPFMKDGLINVRGEPIMRDLLYGDSSAPIRAYLGAYNLILFTLIFAAALIEMKKPSENTIFAILLLGAALFYAFWEVNRRYSLSSLPYITLFTTPALHRLAETTPKQALQKIAKTLKGA